MEGLVVKSTGSWYDVRSNGVQYKCRIKGVFKNDANITSTNPLAVGDIVGFELEDGTEQGMIHFIAPRKNYIVRKSPHNRHLRHIIASNLDQALVIISLKEPRIPLGFIDRFTVACASFHVPCAIVFNKMDLNGPKENELLEEWRTVYENLGLPLFFTSTKTGEGIDDLLHFMKDKICLFSGQSGVGKSSLLNLIAPVIKQKTLNISKWSGKGQHSTTFAEMFFLDDTTGVIDTPGIKELGLLDIEATELSGYFAEMKPLITECGFNDCKHTHEPQCAVLDAARSGKIYIERYKNYLNMLASIEDEKKKYE